MNQSGAGGGGTDSRGPHTSSSITSTFTTTTFQIPTGGIYSQRFGLDVFGGETCTCARKERRYQEEQRKQAHCGGLKMKALTLPVYAGVFTQECI